MWVSSPAKSRPTGWDPRFEGWLDRLVETAGFDGVRVVATAGIEPITFKGDTGDDHVGVKENAWKCVLADTREAS